MDESVKFLIPIILTLLLSWPAREIFLYYRPRITWKEFMRALRSADIIEELTGPNRPDVIIGLNGGAVAAAILAFNYFIDECYIISLLEYVGLPEHRPTASPQLDLPPSVIYQKVLIIDDQYITGTSMRLAVEGLVNFGVPRANIRRYAVCRYKIPGGAHDLDIESPILIPGRLKWAPWLISEKLTSFYGWRAKITK